MRIKILNTCRRGKTRHWMLETGVWLLGFILSAFFISPSYADEGLTLRECYQLALKRSETIAINEQIIKEAEGQFLQSLSSVLPQVDFAISQERQDAPRNSSISRNVPERRFTFSQPLFSGFKEFAGIAAAKAQHKERESQLQRAKELLFGNVSDAFYFLESYQQDLKAVEDIHQALVERVNELKRRQNLGRSRESEVANAESLLYQNEADAESVRSQLEVGLQLLEFLIGRPVTAIKEEELPNDTVEGLENFVSRAHERSDVKAAQEALVIARKNVIIAKAGFWPTVSVDGNSYTKRAGTSANVDWDITLNVNVPIFHGTQTIGEVKQAKAQEKEAELFLSQVQRSALLDIQNSYTRFVTDQKRELAFKKAADAANRNYQLQEADYKNSLVNNLDVLQALEDKENSMRNYIAVKNETKRFYWNLKISTGDIAP